MLVSLPNVLPVNLVFLDHCMGGTECCGLEADKRAVKQSGNDVKRATKIIEPYINGKNAREDGIYYFGKNF